MLEIAGEIDFTNIVIENKLFEDLCVIADNLKDEFNDKIFAILFRRSLFWKTGAQIIVSFVFKQTF